MGIRRDLEVHRKNLLQPRKKDYWDRRAWNRRALLASYLGAESSGEVTLEEDKEIELVSTEPSEVQRQAVRL